MNIVAIHQPNYLPWLGYFFKLFLADTLLLYDTAEINKAGYTRRVKIRSKHNESADTWLTLPLNKFSDSARICDIEVFQPEESWEKHKNLFYEHYHQAPFWKELEEMLQYHPATTRLSEFNAGLIKLIADQLNVEATIVYSSDLQSDIKGPEYNLFAALELGASHYIRGKGEQVYGAAINWAEYGIAIANLDFPKLMSAEKVWQSKFPTWLPGLSIIDSIAYAGTGAIVELFKKMRLDNFPELISS